VNFVERFRSHPMLAEHGDTLVRKTFEALDSDGDGVISTHDIANAIVRCPLAVLLARTLIDGSASSL